MKIRVNGCSRCLGDHGELEFEELDHPIDAGTVELTHWAPCPTNGQPMLWGRTDAAWGEEPATDENGRVGEKP
jgi:hypothetical protein